MSEREDALQATAEDLIADAEELKALERQTSSMSPDDPRQDALADEAVDLVRDMVPKAVAQQEIVKEDGEEKAD